MLHLERDSSCLWPMERGMLHFKRDSCGLWLIERGMLHLERDSCGLWLIELGMLHLKRACCGLGLENEECYIWSALVMGYGLKNEEYYCWNVLVSLYCLYSLYNEEIIRSVLIKQTDRTNRQRTVPWCHNEMHTPYLLGIRTVSNSDGLYEAYDPSTALSIQTVTIRTDRRDRNTPCSDVIMRCPFHICSEYGP